LDEVGNCLLVGVGIITAGWRLADSALVVLGLPAFFVANCLVLIVSFCSKRQGRGSCWRLAVLAAKPLSVLAALQRSLQSHHLVRRHVYALRLCMVLRTDKALGRAIRSLNGFRGPRRSRRPRQLLPHRKDSCDDARDDAINAAVQ